jgi:hypothetical protein
MLGLFLLQEMENVPYKVRKTNMAHSLYGDLKLRYAAKFMFKKI